MSSVVNKTKLIKRPVLVVCFWTCGSKKMRSLTFKERKKPPLPHHCLFISHLLFLCLSCQPFCCLYPNICFVGFPFHLNRLPLTLSIPSYFSYCSWSGFWLLNEFTAFVLSSLSTADYVPFSSGVSEGAGQWSGHLMQTTVLQRLIACVEP